MLRTGQYRAGSITLRLIVLAAGLMSCNGCAWVALGVNDAHHMSIERATTPRRTTRFLVTDAESGQPIAGATVWAVNNFDWMSDWVDHATTDASGVALLKLATDYMHLLHIGANADGYLTRDGDANDAGMRWLSDTEVEIELYKGPAPMAGLVVPKGFSGIVTYGSIDEKGRPTTRPNLARLRAFMHPPEFPAGQRVWWNEISADGYVSFGPMPYLGIGGSSGNVGSIVAKSSDGTPIPVAEPGAKVDGTAVWFLGVNTPNGNWAGEQHVLFVGDRASALEQARLLFSRHHNGAGGWIYNGWLREVSPELKLSGANAFSVTRTDMNQPISR